MCGSAVGPLGNPPAGENERLPRVLVTGGAGLVGSALLESAPPGVEVHATRRYTAVHGAPAHPVDLANEEQVTRLWEEVRPALVIHTAYGTRDGERDIVQATRNVAEACARSGADLVHLSTDALFDGEHAPYAESDLPAAIHEYGRWKAQAERLVREHTPRAAIIRTSLICSTDPLDPRSAWVADALRKREPVTLYLDELRCPTGATDLAAQIWEITTLPANARAGVWHLAGPEVLSRYALGVLIAAREGLDPAGITPALASSSPLPRPRDLRLLTSRADRALRTHPRPISVVLLGPEAGPKSPYPGVNPTFVA